MSDRAIDPPVKPYPPALTPEILFEDQHLCVLSKPAGLLSQGERTDDLNLVDWLRGHFGRNYVGLIHRLDRNTSGIMIVAKRTKSAQRLTESLQAGKVDRSYLGWALGNLDATRRWKHFLLKNEAKNLVQIVPEGRPGGKIAVLSANPMAHGTWDGQPVTLIRYELETGRSHQIRVQTAQEGFPLIGDLKYGGAKLKHLADFGRPALHSFRLVFEHPMSKERMEFEAALPKDMASVQSIK